jgi:hypothetical protein
MEAQHFEHCFTRQNWNYLQNVPTDSVILEEGEFSHKPDLSGKVFQPSIFLNWQK